MTRLCRAIVAMAALGAAFGLSGEARSGSLRALNLEQLVAHAGDIVLGRCVAVRALPPHGGVPVAEITLRVDRALKGTAHGTLTFRVVAPEPGEGDADGASPPHFEAGEDLLLFLYRAGPSGLTSPVGFGQGKFLRRPGKDGREAAVNRFGNRGLLEGISPQAAPHVRALRDHGDAHGPLRTADLVDAIEGLAR